MDIVYAKGDAHLPTPWGSSRHIQIGSHWSADDPVVRANPDLFSADPQYGLNSSEETVYKPRVFVGGDDDADDGAEQATAAPGEKRYARRPRSGE